MIKSFGVTASAFACALGLVVLAADAHAQVTLYTETFPWTGTTTQDLELRAQGWCGGNAGDDGCNNPPGTAANNGGEGGISSSLTGPADGVVGVGFWSQTNTFADSFLYTKESPLPLDPSQLTSVTWYQRDSTNEPQRLAFLIDSVWYITEQSWVNNNSSSNSPENWMLRTADISDLTFFTIPQSGTLLPDSGCNVSPTGGTVLFPSLGLYCPSTLTVNQPLPSDQIDAFGFWWAGPKNATSRVDDVKLLTADEDDDGVPDDVDACPTSDLSATVVIDGCASGVANPVDETGCTIADGVAACAAGAGNHGGFVSCVAGLTNDLVGAGLISGREKGAIQRCAARADLP